MICIKCGKEFVLRADHEGFANICPSCSEGDVDRVMGKVAWSGKHTMELEITSNRAEAIAFNATQKRIGAGVIRSITQPKESPMDSQNYSKRGSGAEAGAEYKSKLGERRNVKR